MAVDKDTLTFAVDGILVQCRLAMQTLEVGSVEHLSVQAVMASAMTLRELITEALPEDYDPDRCQHPAAARREQLVGGGHFFIICTKCNEIVEQG